MAGIGIVTLFIVFAFVAPLALYALVRSEHNHRESMDRQSAERAARRDTDDRE
jgi:hypothetical protein